MSARATRSGLSGRTWASRACADELRLTLETDAVYPDAVASKNTVTVTCRCVACRWSLVGNVASGDRHLTLPLSLTLELRPFRLRILLQRILELPSPPCSSRRVRRRGSWVLGACRVSWRAYRAARERV